MVTILKLQRITIITLPRLSGVLLNDLRTHIWEHEELEWDNVATFANIEFFTILEAYQNDCNFVHCNEET